MRVDILLRALAVCLCGISAPASRTETPDQAVALLQRNSDISAAKRKRPYHVPVEPRGYGWQRGITDPSIGPDGRPYRVPEYLRNQCYIDDGYGRFSACPNR